MRLFEPADQSAVLSLWSDTFPATAPHHDPAESLRRKLACRDDLLFVAEVDGELVGTVMVGYDGHRGWIYSLAVKDDCRRAGIGTMLMNHAEDVLRRRDCPKVNLQVMPQNAEVVAFYESLGYAVEERISMGKTFSTPPAC